MRDGRHRLPVRSLALLGLLCGWCLAPLPSLAQNAPSGCIELRVDGPVVGLLWTMVQWLDASGDWHDVTGWQSPLNDSEAITWWVAQRDYGKGPFRWCLYRRKGGELLATSQEFHLPLKASQRVVVRVALRLQPPATPTYIPWPGEGTALGIIKQPEVSLRAGPGAGFRTLGLARRGQKVRMIGRTEDVSWVLILTPDGQQGWAWADYIELPENLEYHNAPVTAPPAKTGRSTLPLQPTSHSTSTATATPPASPAAKAARGVIRRPAMHVRAGPGTSYPILGLAYQGQIVDVAGRTQDGSWFLIVTADGLEGWAWADYIELQGDLADGVPAPTPSPAMATWAASATQPTSTPTREPSGSPQAVEGVISHRALNVRAGPSTEFAILGQVYRGQIVRVIGRTGSASWVLIVTPLGQQGWAWAEYIEVGAPLESITVSTVLFRRD